MTTAGTARAPLDVDGCRELAVVERSGLIESRHLGAAVVVDADGTVLRAIGDVTAAVYPRSSVKPLQALSVLRSGVALDGERLALASSSHAGTPEHVRVVGEVLALAGLDEHALHCPPDWPLDPDSAALARTGVGRRRITMNCSGKHASFLLACAHNAWSSSDYLDPLHPIQRLVKDTVETLSHERIDHVGTDGCGAPLFAMSLRGLAVGVSYVASSADQDAQRLANAIRSNGWAIDGPGRANTVVIDELGLVAKGGAEGVMVMASASGAAVALKVLDGSQRATTLVALELLAQEGVIARADADRVIDLTRERILGGGLPVGAIRATV